jgi:hypothetical protein
LPAEHEGALRLRVSECTVRLAGGCGKPLRIEAIDDDGAPRLGERHRAALAEPTARRTDNGLAAGDSEIHGLPSSM